MAAIDQALVSLILNALTLVTDEYPPFRLAA